MSRTLTDAEAAVHANRLKQNELARQSLVRQPRRVAIGLVIAALCYAASQWAIEWRLSPIQAALLGAVIAAVPALAYEVIMQRRQINALITLLREQLDGGA